MLGLRCADGEQVDGLLALVCSFPFMFQQMKETITPLPCEGEAVGAHVSAVCSGLGQKVGVLDGRGAWGVPAVGTSW